MKQNQNGTNRNAEEKRAGWGMLAEKRSRKGPAERMWAPGNLKLDENYSYISKNRWLHFLYYFTMFAGMPFVYLYYKIRWRFQVINREHVKLIRKQAAITVANHVYNQDSFMLTNAFYPNAPHFVALRHNFEAFLVGGLVRVMRGIPLPEDLKNFERFLTQVGDALRHSTRKIHFYPEGEIAPYSRELRPFRKGAFHLAVKNNVPVMPFVFVFPAKNRIKLIAGTPIRLEDVPGAEGWSKQKQVVLLAEHVKQTMQNMMDKYYASCH